MTNTASQKPEWKSLYDKSDDYNKFKFADKLISSKSNDKVLNTSK